MLTPSEESDLLRLLRLFRNNQLVNIGGHVLTLDTFGNRYLIGSRKINGLSGPSGPSGPPGESGPPGANCGDPWIIPILIDSSITKTTAVVSGTTVVTDIVQTNRYRNLRKDSAGCITLDDAYTGYPYCNSGPPCSSGPETVQYWCSDRTCYTVYGGLTIPGMLGPYATILECAAACAGSGGGGTVVTPCGTISRNLKVTYSTGQVFTIAYSVGSGLIAGQWFGFYGPSFNCSSGASLVLTCYTDGHMDITAVASWRGPASTTVVPTSASPFLLMYTGPAFAIPACPDISFIVTEV